MTSLALAPAPSSSDIEVNALPHNLEAEQAILGALLFDNQVTEWMIGFDNEDQIAALLFRPVEQ